MHEHRGTNKKLELQVHTGLQRRNALLGSLLGPRTRDLQLAEGEGSTPVPSGGEEEEKGGSKGCMSQKGSSLTMLVYKKMLSAGSHL